MDHDLENEESAEEDSASPQLRLLTTEDPEPPMSTKQFWRLCTSHILSTWNARVYEFAAILFTAAAFPDTLLASSIRGLCVNSASICLSPWIGHCIDHSTSRLSVLLLTISLNRAAIILACAAWVFLVDDKISPERLSSRILLFILIIAFGTLEKLSGIGNMLSMERDWIPILAATSSVTTKPTDELTRLNAVIRRIDLMCKLIGPLVISLIITASGSTTTGVLAVAGMSCISWTIEICSARLVWRSSKKLQAAKNSTEGCRRSVNPHIGEQQKSLLQDTIHGQLRQFKQYFGTNVWVPSLSLAILHFSVLSYNATFITYLLNSGFSLLAITVARALGTVVEVSSTFIVPWGIQYLAQSSARKPHASDVEGLLTDDHVANRQHGVGLERLGLWGVAWQLINLMPVAFLVWQRSHFAIDGISGSIIARIATVLTSPLTNRPLAAASMFFFLSASRLGLWVFDLTTQEITQTRVPPSTRASFAGTEMSFVSFFELSQWLCAAILSKPEYFGWLALVSLAAVGCATAMYASWVWQQRGHLIHWDRVKKGCILGTGLNLSKMAGKA